MGGWQPLCNVTGCASVQWFFFAVYKYRIHNEGSIIIIIIIKAAVSIYILNEMD